MRTDQSTSNARGCSCLLCLLLIFASSCSLLFEGNASVSVDSGVVPDAETVLPDGTTALSAEISDDFESGSIDPRWRRALENGDSCTVTDEQAESGQYSLRCQTDLISGSKAAIYLDFDPLRSIRVEMDILFTGLPNFYVDFLQASHVSDTESLRLFNADFYNSRQIDAWNFQTSSYEYVGKPILENIWYHITFEGTTSTPNGHVRVMVNNDETSAAELLDIDTTDKPITQIALGITLLNNSVEANTLYIDNVEISEP